MSWGTLLFEDYSRLAVNDADTYMLLQAGFFMRQPSQSAARLEQPGHSSSTLCMPCLVPACYGTSNPET